MSTIKESLRTEIMNAKFLVMRWLLYWFGSRSIVEQFGDFVTCRGLSRVTSTRGESIERIRDDFYNDIAQVCIKHKMKPITISFIFNPEKYSVIDPLVTSTFAWKMKAEILTRKQWKEHQVELAILNIKSKEKTT